MTVILQAMDNVTNCYRSFANGCTESSAVLGSSIVMHTILLTCVAVICFVATRATYNRIRQLWAKVTVVIIGAGPIGLTAALIASATQKVSGIIIYEEKCRNALINRPQQIALNSKSVRILKQLGIDFENIEGCWENDDARGTFFTRIGVFQEYILSILYKLDTPVVLRLKSKFTKANLPDLGRLEGRVVIIVADGVSGSSSRLLGLSDEFIHHSCKSYGAVAAIERADQRQVPTPEIQVRNLTFDLSEYGRNCILDSEQPALFNLKIFGTFRNRYISLAVPKSENKLVKALKVVLDQSIMRNIFVECFNSYKHESESKVSVLTAIRKMRFSPRLFEIKLSHRVENTVYLEDSDIFVTTEGDATRSVNFYSGMGLNLGIQGLQSLGTFILLATVAEAESEVIAAVQYKSNHAQNCSLDFIKNGIKRATNIYPRE